MESIARGLAGFQQSLLPDVAAYWLENPRFAPRPVEDVLGQVLESTPEQELATPEQQPESQPPKSKRVPTGWIEERWGNKSREKKSLSLYYCCYLSEWEVNGEGSKKRTIKSRIYLQAHQCRVIGAMVRDKRPYTEILQAIGRTKIDQPLHRTPQRDWS